MSRTQCYVHDETEREQTLGTWSTQFLTDLCVSTKEFCQTIFSQIIDARGIYFQRQIVENWQFSITQKRPNLRDVLRHSRPQNSSKIVHILDLQFQFKLFEFHDFYNCYLTAVPESIVFCMRLLVAKGRRLAVVLEVYYRCVLDFYFQGQTLNASLWIASKRINLETSFMACVCKSTSDIRT